MDWTSEMGLDNSRQTISKVLHQHPILVYPAHIQLTGSVSAGLALAYLLFQFERYEQDTIWQTNEQIMGATGLTLDELRSAKKKLHLPFLTIRVKGMPAKTYYTIDWEELDSRLMKLKPNQGGKSHKQDVGNPTNKMWEFPAPQYSRV